MRRTLRDRLAGIGRWPRLLAVAACLLLAAVSALSAAHRPGHGENREPRTSPIVIAARTVPAGHVLVTKDLAVARWPSAVSPPGAARSPGRLVGRRLAGPLRDGEAVTATRLVGSALTDGLSPGWAAVPVPLVDPHLADIVHPGGHVELLAIPRSDADDLGGYGDPGTDVGTSDGAGATHRDPVTVVDSRLLVLAVLPADPDAPDSSPALVVAADGPTTLTIARLSGIRGFTAVPLAP